MEERKIALEDGASPRTVGEALASLAMDYQ